MQFIGQRETLSQQRVVGAENMKNTRGFGKDITNESFFQKGSKMNEDEKKESDIDSAEMSNACSLRQMVRNFVRVEWRTAKSEAVRNQQSASSANVSYSSAKLTTFLEGTEYKLPYIRTSKPIKKKRNKAERAAFRKSVVMRLEKGLQAMISGRKVDDEDIQKGTGCVWKTDALGDFLYFDRSTNEKVTASDYYSKYNCYLQSKTEESDSLSVFVDIRVEEANQNKAEDIVESTNSQEVLEEVNNTRELTVEDIEKDYEAAVEKAQIKCWNTIQSALKSFESHCNELRKTKVEKLTRLGKSEHLADEAAVSSTSFNFFCAGNQGIGPRGLAVEPKNSISQISDLHLKKSRGKNAKKRKKKKRKDVSNRRRSIVNVSHVPSFSDADSDDIFCNQNEEESSEDCVDGESLEVNNKKSKRRRSLCGNVEMEDMLNENEENKDDDLLL